MHSEKIVRDPKFDLFQVKMMPKKENQQAMTKIS